jgi:hypothetical protein
MKLVAKLLEWGWTPGDLQLLKWSLMICAIVWTLVFQLGEDRQALPEFVYVNF